MCRQAGLIRLGLVALDRTKLKANAGLDANRSAATLDAHIARIVAEAEATDAGDRQDAEAVRGSRLPRALARRGDRLARLSHTGTPARPGA
jgi:hypothetical protein